MSEVGSSTLGGGPPSTQVEMDAGYVFRIDFSKDSADQRTMVSTLCPTSRVTESGHEFHEDLCHPLGSYPGWRGLSEKP